MVGSKSARRRSKNSSNGYNYGAGTSFGSYGSGPRAYPGFFKRGQFHSLVSTDTSRISCGIGNQGWGVLPGAVFATPGAPTTLTGSRYLPSLDLMNYITTDLLRDTQTPGAAFTDAVGVVTNPGYLSQKFVIPMISLKHELKNQTNLAVHVSLYDIVLRETQTTPGTPQPIQDISTGLLQERTGYSIARNGGSPESGLGVTPFQSSLFCKRWKVVKTTTLVIPAGSTHVHTFINKPKRMFSFDDDSTVSQANNVGITGQGQYKAYQGYVTTATIARVWGGVADDSVNVQQVYNAAAAVDCVTRCYLKYGQFIKNKRVHAIYTTEAAGTGNAQTMTEDSDLPSAVVTA